MQPLVVTLMLLLYQPVADPTYFSYNSPQCIAHKLKHFNPLPLIVRTERPPCPWSAEDAAQIEVSRHLSIYSWWNFERTTNLELAASKLDGTMLLPGEEFSYNEEVGERTKEAGFKIAKVIDSHGYTEGIGGGICQVASNLHAAALMAGLDITERNLHRFRVKYMPPGLDATVDYGKKDLKIVNNTFFPVVFHMGRMEKGEFLTRIMAPLKTFRVKYKYEVVEEALSDTVTFNVYEKPGDRVEYYGRPGLTIEKTIWRRNVHSRKLEKVRVRNDKYSPSPWTLRVTELPAGKRVLSGLSKAKIEGFLKGTRYTVDSARFRDVERDTGKYLPRSYVNKKKMRKFYKRFSDVRAEQVVAKAE